MYRNGFKYGVIFGYLSQISGGIYIHNDIYIYCIIYICKKRGSFVNRFLLAKSWIRVKTWSLKICSTFGFDRVGTGSSENT